MYTLRVSVIIFNRYCEICHQFVVKMVESFGCLRLCTLCMSCFKDLLYPSLICGALIVLQILWRGQEAMAETMNTEEWDKGAGIRVVERPASYGAGDNSA
jgi:hypothetical protein